MGAGQSSTSSIGSLFSIARNAVDDPGSHADDHAALCAAHVEVGADLGAVVLEGLGRRGHVALPVDHHLRRAVLIEGNCVDDPFRRLLVRIGLGGPVDRELRREAGPEGGDLGQR